MRAIWMERDYLGDRAWRMTPELEDGEIVVREARAEWLGRWWGGHWGWLSLTPERLVFIESDPLMSLPWHRAREYGDDRYERDSFRTRVPIPGVMERHDAEARVHRRQYRSDPDEPLKGVGC